MAAFDIPVVPLHLSGDDGPTWGHGARSRPGPPSTPIIGRTGLIAPHDVCALAPPMLRCSAGPKQGGPRLHRHACAWTDADLHQRAYRAANRVFQLSAIAICIEKRQLLERAAVMLLRMPSPITQQNQPHTARPTAVLLSRDKKGPYESDAYGHILDVWSKCQQHAHRLQRPCNQSAARLHPACSFCALQTPPLKVGLKLFGRNESRAVTNSSQIRSHPVGARSARC